MGSPRSERSGVAMTRWPKIPPSRADGTARRHPDRLGFVMLFQPFLLDLYSYSFVTMLVGTLMFIVVTKFPE